ncbi:hypothetical protein M2451_003852 [Dysgonomonas sp. PFB1-18]|uniref:hypothetical protein n=1 Tax=unclassified Dysgonomonas TaxID=2630389 RepID=UPI002473E56F|nr:MULTISPECIES: hypothetical protein [unclassified Dysgonomonas]MDH6309466.1 hypothetical protein [Dysgonomonas sp. PF1-14]MDH6340876.1 hypothetical protein [Dysgonomonas sp. PF1-16]MDH6382511.1 hypothetical protein [Dysgonomonas sp. PFB1-18]MDH6399845.1 hypothetical protein [Dysgonomonas sp. PF1-23]
MNKKYNLFIWGLFFSFIFSCTTKNWYDIKDSQGNTFIGTWFKLTEIDGENVIYIPCDAYNMEIKVTKDKKEIFVRYGIEDISYEIDTIQIINDEFIFILKNSKDKITCHVLQDSAIWVIPNNIKILCTNTPNKYQHVKEENMSEVERIKEDIEKYALANLYENIDNLGFSGITLNKFNQGINRVFAISDTINNVKISNHKSYFVYLIEKGCNHHELLKSEFDYTIPNIIFSTTFLFVSDIETLLMYINEDENKDFLLKRCFHRNMYIFNESQASLTWLINNDKEFLISLLKTFGYDKEPRINKFVLQIAYQKCQDKNNNVHYNYEDCNDILFSRDCSNNLRINHGLLATVKDLTTAEDGLYLEMLYKYLIHVDSNSLNLNLSDEEKIEIYCSFGSVEIELIKKYLHSRNGDGAQWNARMNSFISSLLNNYRDEYQEIARKHNYWNITNFDEIVQVGEWEFPVVNGDEEFKEPFDYIKLK